MLTMKSTFQRAKSLGRDIFLLTAASTLSLAIGTGFLSNVTRASDLDAAITDSTAPIEADSSQFVRLGLNKSIVVRLPAEARDVIVGNPEIIDAVVRRKNMAYIFARGVGQSNIFFFDANGEQLLNLDVEVAVDSLALKKLLKRTFPGNRVVVDTVNQDIVLSGFAKSPIEAKMILEIATKFASGGSASGGSSSTVNVIDTMKVASEDQVMLKVKVVEIQRDVLKQLGVDLQAVLAAGETVFNFASINPFKFAGFPTGGGDQVTDNTGDFKFNRVMKALESDGLSRTLAEPNLTAVTGQPAKFHAGGEIPFEVCDKDGQCTVEFKEFGVNLDFTPLVLNDGRIRLKLSTRISELSALQIRGVPAIDARTTETTLELPSGGSMMIAGLIKETTRQNISGLPGLKRLPILGSLFRSREFQANETELVVIVTPYLVNPVAPKQLTTPDKNFNPATDAHSYLFGKLHKTYGSNGKAPVGNYNGNVGFIVE